MAGGSDGMPDLGESMDPATFEQILDMDEEDDDREFSRSIVYGFFEQAESTFDKMEDRIKNRDLHELSQLGHFLKGSSAIIGLNYIKQSCEKIQHWGNRKDETGMHDQPSEACLKSIELELGKMRKEYRHVEWALKKFYGES